MTVSSIARRAGPFPGNGVTTSLPFAFPCQAAEDLKVYHTNVSGFRAPLSSSAYTVVLNVDQQNAPGGTVILAIAPLNGESTEVHGATRDIQPADLQNLGRFYPNVLEDALDRGMMRSRELEHQIGGALRVPDMAGVAELPVRSQRYNTIPGFDATGLPVVLSPAQVADRVRPYLGGGSSTPTTPTTPTTPAAVKAPISVIGTKVGDNAISVTVVIDTSGLPITMNEIQLVNPTTGALIPGQAQQITGTTTLFTGLAAGSYRPQARSVGTSTSSGFTQGAPVVLTTVTVTDAPQVAGSDVTNGQNLTLAPTQGTPVALAPPTYSDSAVPVVKVEVNGAERVNATGITSYTPVLADVGGVMTVTWSHPTLGLQIVVTTQPVQATGGTTGIRISNASSNSARTNQITVAREGASTAGDALLIHVSIAVQLNSQISGLLSFTASGFSMLAESQSQSADGSVAVASAWYYKRDTGAEPASYTSSVFSSTQEAVSWSFVRVKGYGGSVSGAAANSGRGAVSQIPSFIPAMDASIVLAGIVHGNPDGVAFTAPSGWASFEAQSNVVPISAFGVAIKHGSGGATPSAVINSDADATAPWAMVVVGLGETGATVPSTPTTDEPGMRFSPVTTQGPTTAASGDVIQGKVFNSPSATAIYIPPTAANVELRDLSMTAGPAGLTIDNQGPNTQIHHLTFSGTHRIGIRNRFVGAGTKIYKNDLGGVNFAGGNTGDTYSMAIAVQYSPNGCEVNDNWAIGSYGFTADAFSVYSSSNVRFCGNVMDVNISWMHAAPFTMGDAGVGDTNSTGPGTNNYVAGNYVRQTGGVAPGVFGSAGYTLMEHNCLASGAQIYNYAGQFVGVTARNNAILMSNAGPIDADQILQWNTNVNGTTPAAVPYPGLGYYDLGGNWVATLLP